MPGQGPAQTRRRIVYAVYQTADLGLMPSSALIIQRANRDVTGTRSVTEQFLSRRRQNATVMLRDDVLDIRDMGGIVKYDALLAVMNV